MRRRPSLPSGLGCLQLQWGLHVERENSLPGVQAFWKKPCLHPCQEKHAKQEHEVCAFWSLNVVFGEGTSLHGQCVAWSPRRKEVGLHVHLGCTRGLNLAGCPADIGRLP